MIPYSGPIVTRKEALVAGLKRFFTGKACPHGHITQRTTVNSNCIECKRLKDARDYAADPQKHIDAVRAWQLRNGAEEYLRVSREHRRARRQYFRDYARSEKGKQQRKLYKAKNPEAVRSYWINRRARERGATGTFSGVDIADIRRLQRDRCAEPTCRCKLNGKGHTDHIIPLALGGSNDRRNLQLLCGPCNWRKNAKDPLDFARELGRLI